MRFVTVLLLAMMSMGAVARDNARDAAQVLSSAGPGGTFGLAPVVKSDQARLSGQKPASEPSSNAALFAGEKDGEAVLSYAFSGRLSGLSVSLAAPWNDSGNTELANLDGLAGATRLKLHYSRIGDPSAATPWIFGASGEAGYDDFEFFDAAGAKQSDRKRVWSGEMKGGIQYHDGFAVFGLKRASAYENDSDSEGSLCTTRSANTLTCDEGFLAPPKHTQTWQGSLDFIWAFQDLPAAIGLHGVRDFKEDTTGLELSLFLLRGEEKDKVGPFTGGVKLGWRNDLHHVTAGVFVSTPLSYR